MILPVQTISEPEASSERSAVTGSATVRRSQRRCTDTVNSDADKLDIYRIVLERIRSGEFRPHLKAALGIVADGPVTPEAVEDILENRTVGNGNIRTAADFCLMQISWVFDINYSPPLRQIRERGYIEEIARFLPADSGSLTAKEHILSFLESGDYGSEPRINPGERG